MRLDILEAVFKDIVVPVAVYDEVVGNSAERPGARDIENSHWIEVRPPQDINLVASLAQRIDRGEAAAIALALELGSDARLLIDDRRGRSLAMSLGIGVYGSGGVLVLAKQRGVLKEVRPVLYQLRAAGLYLSDSVHERLLAQAGE